MLRAYLTNCKQTEEVDNDCKNEQGNSDRDNSLTAGYLVY